MRKRKSPEEKATKPDIQQALNSIGARLDRLEQDFKAFKQEVESAVGLKRP